MSMCLMRKIYAVGSSIDLIEKIWLKNKQWFKVLAVGSVVGSSKEFSEQKGIAEEHFER